MTYAVTGIPSDYRAPIHAAEILLAQGPSSAPTAARDAIYLGPMTSSGTATAATLYECGDEKTAIDLAGPGSPVHRAVRYHLRANKNGRVYVLPYAATSGGAPAAATATLTVTVTTAASGSVEFQVCEETIRVAHTSSSTATTIGDDIEAKINAMTHLPVTASNSSGTVTLTTKVMGTSQNGIYRLRVNSVTAGAGVALAASAATLSGGAEGTTTEEANLTAALATIDGQRMYYVGTTVGDATRLAVVKTHIVNKSEPKKGLRSVAVAASVDTLSATQTIATGLNFERVQLVWQKNSDHDLASLVGNVIAVRQKREQVDAAYNFDNYSEPDWLIRPAYAVADRPDSDDLNDAVTDGITPIASNQVKSRLVMSVNTRSKDSTGALDDFRAAETHRVSVMDLFADTVLLNHALTYKGFKQMDDVYNSDGTVDVNARIPPNVITPSRWKAWYLNIVNDFIELGLLQRQAEWRESTDVRIDPLNNSRLQVRSSGRVVDLAHQLTVRLSETTPN